MYEELIKRLRRCEQFRCRECEYENVLGCRAKLNKEAADAIEELQKDLERSKDFEEFWMHEAEEALRKYQVAIAKNPHKYPCVYCDDKLYCTKDAEPNDYKPFCGLGQCPYKTPSNADRIRAMSDEELGKFMKGCPPNRVQGRDCMSLNSCSPCWLDWLEREADDGRP